MSTIVPTISGPKRPQDKVLLTDASKNFEKSFKEFTNKKDFSISKVANTDYEIKDGSILNFSSLTSEMIGSLLFVSFSNTFLKFSEASFNKTLS